MPLFTEQEDRLAPLVVVFGGAGYIGSCFIRLLLSEGYRVRVFDNFLFSSAGLKGLNTNMLQVVCGDICDTRAVASAVKGADAVVLLSAIVGHLALENLWADSRIVNYLASSAVLDAAVEEGASRFIFASTSSVYGIQSGVMYETTTPEPVSLYSRLKLRMEERVINARRREFHPTALRIATCHGVSPRMRFDLVLNGLVRDALWNKRIHIASGEQVRALVHVEDAAQALLSCLTAHENLINGETFNVGASEQTVKIKDLANLVKKFIPDTEITFRRGEPDLVDYYLSCAKIEKVLDFRPQWTIERSIEQVRNLLLQNRIKDPYGFRYRNT